ncbi:MAG TPA: ATP-binding protein [Nitrososphaeraceae archaeon]|nr:ATP-binding protein [Nitrososphaeraceae archaeon]
MTGAFEEINNITRVDGLFIADRDDIITYNIVGKGERSFVNIDISSRDYVQRTRESSSSVISEGYRGIDGILRIAITYPIVNRDTNQYIGLVGVQMPAVEFFRRYGNVYDIESQYLAVLDRGSIQLAHPVESFIGTPFFGNLTQEATGNNSILNNLIQTVMSGQAGSAIYEFRNQERLNTGYPISMGARPEYFIFMITPTEEIYAHISDVLFAERLKMLSLIIGAAAAIFVLIIFLVKWNGILNSQVKRRTKELEESNDQLKYHDKLKEEFVNTAAHELRTPIQPILGVSELLTSEASDPKLLRSLDIITRNAKRLQRLADDVLDVSRIESESLVLRKQRINLNDLLDSIVQEYRDRIGKQNYNKMGENTVESSVRPVDIDISYRHPQVEVWISADKVRLVQVITNLLDNSMKFIQSTRKIERKKPDQISIVSVIKDNRVEVSVSDTGPGIDPEVAPRLFTKFASKSFSGTGLGLFLSKKIIEAHGGTISARNNDSGIGAIFAFSFPIAE